MLSSQFARGCELDRVRTRISPAYSVAPSRVNRINQFWFRRVAYCMRAELSRVTLVEVATRSWGYSHRSEEKKI